jgi:hypothetical protein
MVTIDFISKRIRDGVDGFCVTGVAVHVSRMMNDFDGKLGPNIKTKTCNYLCPITGLHMIKRRAFDDINYQFRAHFEK